MSSGAPDVSQYGPRAGFLVPLPSAERGVATVLGCSPCGKFLAYGSGSVVIVRSVENPSLAFAYTDHADGTTVKAAKFSPSGKFVASGDSSGKVRVWAFTNTEHSLKYELPSIGGPVEDLAWDSESKRILAVGGGAAKAKFFAFDTGSQLGEVIPASKKNLTCDFKPSRPFKAVMGSEDFSLAFYSGPPFRYEKGITAAAGKGPDGGPGGHTNFVNAARFNPDGSRFLSVSSDKQGLVFDGTTAALIGRLDSSPTVGHTGSLYACAWSADGTKAVTCSGDKTVKMWDMSGAGPVFPCLATFTLGSTVESMQEGLCWPSPDLIVSLSLEGTLNFLAVGKSEDSAATPGPVARVFGHQAAAQWIDVDRESGQIVTGDLSGRVCVWKPQDEKRTVYAARPLKGEVATKKIAGVATAGGEVVVAAWDDKLRLGETATEELKTTIALPGQPKGVAIAAGNPKLKVVVTGSAILTVVGTSSVSHAAAYGPTCVDVSADGKIVAVGGKDKKIHLYSCDPSTGALTDDGETKEFGAEISVVALHPDGASVAGGDGLREVRLYGVAPGEKDKPALRAGRWVYHTTRVTGLKWSPNGKHLVSVSTDRRLCVWSAASDTPTLSIDLANPSPFAAVAWADDTRVWTLGTDGVGVLRTLPL